MHSASLIMSERNRRTRLAADQPVSPPAIAVISPIHELLIADVAAGIPYDLRLPLRTAMTIDALNDWIAAAAMFRWVANDAHLKQVFLDALGNDPKQAPLAVARVLAARLQPDRDNRWSRANRRFAVRLVMVSVAATLLAVWIGRALALW